MTRDRLHTIVEARLAEWNRDLVADHSTPLLLLGVGHDHKSGSLSLCHVKDMDRGQVVAFLLAAAEMLLKGEEAHT